ncbi:copper ion binding protein [Haloactinospora alba]|uniref:Copper ion binding protein n=1 Tax=Haloactinospora alba TaxID=405555 RepID=A0A543NND7_9ACTN|nr:cation transporter [Haloactinospora alba]TQN33286.1 copper ion binding protein [Haloactinospora alba]
MAGTTSAVYEVEGMSCGHCVNAVREEVGALAGVTDVQVDLDTGRVTVASEGGVSDELVRGAVREAGYEVKG